MKIPTHTHSPRPTAHADVTARPSATPGHTEEGARGASGSTRAAEVRMSDSARALRGARAPEKPDMAKVERLRAQIQAGEFKVDPERIASAMMEEER